MELELGLKITKTRDNVTSANVLQIAKDRAGPVFFSRETESMFVLTAHLKGFRKERIKIEINVDGSQISISGDKPVQEMVMVRWRIYNKEIYIKSFRKVFWIPEGVILNKINANFNEEEAILSIFMPKLKKGIQGIEIRQVEDVALVEAESSGTTTPPVVPDENILETEQLEVANGEAREDQNEQNEPEKPEIQCVEELEDIIPTTNDHMETQEISPPALPEIPPPALPEIHESYDTITEKQESEEEATKFESDQVFHEPEQPPEQHSNVVEPETLQDQPTEANQPVETTDLEPSEASDDDEVHHEHEHIGDQRQETEIIGEKEEKHQAQLPEDEERIEDEKQEDLGNVDEAKQDEDCKETEKKESKPGAPTPSRRSLLCSPCFFAGSAFISFLIVLVFQLITKHRNSRKR